MAGTGSHQATLPEAARDTSRPGKRSARVAADGTPSEHGDAVDIRRVAPDELSAPTNQVGRVSEMYQTGLANLEG